MKLAQLRGNIREQLQQFLSSVANNTLYLNAFFLQRVQRCAVQGVGLMFDLTHKQRLPADAVHQHHHAKIAAEIGGVHDDVGLGGLRVALPDLHLLQAAVDSLAATTVLRGKLCRGLFARTIGRPKLIGV